MHANGIVHRDIKAANVIVVGEGHETTLSAKVADFGLACGERTVKTRIVVPKTNVAVQYFTWGISRVL